MYDKTFNIHNTHSLKISYQLIDSLNKLKNIVSFIMYDFKCTFKNINLQVLEKIINSLFQDFYSHLQLSNNVDMDCF